MPSDSPLTPATRRVIFALVFGTMLPLLDTSVVNVAIRPLASTFAVSVGLTQWMITGYALASAVAIILTGFVTRKFGATAVWRTAIIVFTVASVLCALAWNIESLIVFRTLQGFAAGLSMPVMQTILMTSAGKQQATRAMTAVGLPAVIAPVLGPLLGGLLLDTLGWQSIFLINLPIGIIALILAIRILPRSTPDDVHARLDLTGFLLLAPAMTLAVYGLTTAETASRTSITVLFIAVAGILISGYWIRAKRTTLPLIDIAVFSYPSFTSAWLSLLLSSIIFYGGLFLVPLYYQTAHGYTSLQTGLLLGLLGLGAIISRSLATRLSTRWGTRTTVYFFIACTVIGTIPFTVTVTHDTVWLLTEAVSLIVRGGGIGAVTMLTMSSLYHQMPARHIVHASALSRVATQLGSALGVATCTAFLSITHGITHETFVYLTLITACLAMTATALPKGQVIRL